MVTFGMEPIQRKAYRNLWNDNIFGGKHGTIWTVIGFSGYIWVETNKCGGVGNGFICEIFCKGLAASDQCGRF